MVLVRDAMGTVLDTYTLAEMRDLSDDALVSCGLYLSAPARAGGARAARGAPCLAGGRGRVRKAPARRSRGTIALPIISPNGPR